MRVGESIGFSRGRCGVALAEEVNVHDFPQDALGKAIPYGVFDRGSSSRYQALSVPSLNWSPPWAALQDSSAGVLALLGRSAWRAVPKMIRALEDRSALVRNDAALGLGYVGPVAARAVPALISTLSDKEPEIVSTAAWALGRMKNRGKPAVPALIKLLDSPHPRVRQHSCWGLRFMGVDGAAAIPALTRMLLKDTTPHGDAADALAVMGPAGVAALGLEPQ